MPIGKSIRVFLSDATVSGIRYAELVNWTGQAIACPRIRLSELSEWPEAAKPGVYFLFESRLGEAKPFSYIGESENVTQRLTTHDKNKDFWNEVVIFTSKDENLTKSHIKYLESSLYSLAKTANRYELDNGNTPMASSLPRADRDSMEEFITNIRMVLGVLGHTILEPKLQPKVEKPMNHETSKNRDNTQGIASDLFFSVNGLSAYGSMTDEGFVIKKGSMLSLKSWDSMPGKLVLIKDGLIKSGAIKNDGNALIATEDLLLSSSSYAAALVAGTSRSGPQSWKTKNGKTLKDIEDQSLVDTVN